MGRLRVTRARLAATSLLHLAGGGNLARVHKIANVLLQELVVVVKLIVLFSNGLDAGEYHDERVLQCLGMSEIVSYAKKRFWGRALSLPFHFFPSVLAEPINIFVVAAGAHGADVIGTKVRFHGADGRAIPRHNEGTAALPAGQARPCRDGLMDNRFVCFRFTARHGRGHGAAIRFV